MCRAQSIPLWLVTWASLAVPLIASADERVVVWLKDGRMLTGQLDPRTSDERLWLRSTAPTFVVATSAAWEHIRAVNANGEHLTVEEFLKQLERFRPAQPLPVPGDDATTNRAMPRTLPLVSANAATRIVSLDVEARVANWDQDAASDGVEIRLFPKNTSGEVVPAAGQITVTLLARRQLAAHDRDAFPQLGRWSLQVNTDDVGPAGGVYRLPFQGPHPDNDLALEPYGLIEVSFYVVGHGRFTSEATVCLRNFNPIRRDLQNRQSGRVPFAHQNHVAAALPNARPSK